MTIKPKNKTPKDKNETEKSDHPPRSPTGDSLGHVNGRRTSSPPPRWNSPSPRDDRLSTHDPGGRYTEEKTSGYKRRHRSPHRTSRKHRHDRHERLAERHERPAWDAGARPRVPPTAPLMARDALIPSTSNEQENIEEEHNSGDEYVPPPVPENIADIEAWFEKELKEKRGFIIKRMANDGACMFRAVADQVYGDQEMHVVVRKLVIDYMSKNQDYFSHYITEDFELYLTRKQQPNCHGNHIELQVMTELFNRTIEVYQYNIEPINTFASIHKTDNEPIRLSYHGNVHYNSIVDPYGASVGVGLGLPGYQPGLAEKNLMSDAKKKSEDFHIEQAMLEDKLRETDWEVTQESIDEQVARESYLQWLKDQGKASKTQTSPRSASATCSSAAAATTGAGAAATPWWPSSSDPAPPPPSVSPGAVAGCSSSSPLRPVNDGAVAGSSRSPPPKPPVPDFNPHLYGFTMGNEWDEDDVMAQVIAASQQEYIDSLKNKMSPARSEHSPPPPGNS